MSRPLSCWIHPLAVLVCVLCCQLFSFPEVNLYKSMEVNLLRRLCARSGCGGTPSPLVTEHPSSPQWRLSGAVTSRSPLTPSPPSPLPHPKKIPLLAMLRILLRIMRLWRPILFGGGEAQSPEETYCISCYLLVKSRTLYPLRLYRDVLFGPGCETYSSSSVVSRAAVSRRIGKSIWLPRHSSCNFNSGGTVKWSEDFFPVI